MGVVRLKLLVNVSSSQDLQELVQQLDADRAWLLQQIDGGRWSELRYDLAALERELGQLLTRVSDMDEETKLR
tara:strand:- start:472 stop:690 length:219 start_codon:yes stop_codon:yes gene_type:complete